jgi:SAM-dependent methyltransferase
LYDRYGAALMFAPYAADVVQRLSGMTAGRVLETAAGTGIVTRAMAVGLPDTVEIVATDLNQAMLDHAATKPELVRVRLQQADALALPFAERSFDAVVCQFGIMFFPDRVAGMREARRVLKPGGRFLFSVWGPMATNPVMAEAVAGVAKRYPSHPSWFMERVPCGYHDESEIRADLRATGFADATIETVRLTGRAASARDAATMLCQGSPMRTEIETLDPGGLEAATEAAEGTISARFGAGPLEVPLHALVIETVA